MASTISSGKNSFNTELLRSGSSSYESSSSRVRATEKTLESSVRAMSEAMRVDQGPSSERSAEELRTAMKEIARLMTEFASSSQRDLSFSIHDSTGSVVLQVFQRSTGELLRQIPSGESLRIMELFQARDSQVIDLKA